MLDIPKRSISGMRLKQAKADGKRTYESATECSVCDSAERYVSTRSCVNCTKRKNAERKLRSIEKLPCLLESHLKAIESNYGCIGVVSNAF